VAARRGDARARHAAAVRTAGPHHKPHKFERRGLVPTSEHARGESCAPALAPMHASTSPPPAAHVLIS